VRLRNGMGDPDIRVTLKERTMNCQKATPVASLCLQNKRRTREIKLTRNCVNAGSRNLRRYIPRSSCDPQCSYKDTTRVDTSCIQLYNLEMR